MKIYRFNPSFQGFHIVFPLMIWILTFNRKSAVTLFPFVFYLNRYSRQHIITRNHETIHIQQQMECGMVGGLLYLSSSILLGTWLWTLPAIFLYLWVYLINALLNTRRYKFFESWSGLVAFEREANRFSNIMNYYKLRRPFDWVQYFNIQSWKKNQQFMFPNRNSQHQDVYFGWH